MRVHPVANWDLLSVPDVDEIARSQALAVSRMYRDRSVSALAEFDDLYQEARIILATTLATQVVEQPALAAESLRRDLLNLVRRRGQWARKTDAMTGDAL